MKEEEIAKTVIDSMKSVTDGMKSFLKTESPKPEKTENEKVADMIHTGTKKVLSDRKEREEAEIRRNLITWGGIR